MSRNAHTENLRSATLLSYVVDSATSAHRRHNLSAAGGRLVTSTSASPMEHTTALRRSVGCLRALPMYTCSGSLTRAAVASWSMLDTSVSEGAHRSFPGDVCQRRPGERRGFLVVDSTKPRHLWGSDGRIFSVSNEGSATSTESPSSGSPSFRSPSFRSPSSMSPSSTVSSGFFYFLGQA